MEKEIVSQAEALQQASAAVHQAEQALETVLDAQAAVTPPAVTPPAVTPPAVTPPAVTPPAVTAWKFVKNFCPAETIYFKDGTNYAFRLIQRNDGSGYAPNSFVTTSDKTLADNLREAAKNKHLGIVEVNI